MTESLADKNFEIPTCICPVGFCTSYSTLSLFPDVSTVDLSKLVTVLVQLLLDVLSPGSTASTVLPASSKYDTHHYWISLTGETRKILHGLVAPLL